MDTLARPVKLFILGTGNVALEVADLVSDMPEYQVAGFVASTPPYEPGSTILGIPVYWVDELAQFDDSYRAVCAIGSTKRYRFTQRVEEMGIRFTTIIHPSARVSRTAAIGPGSIINTGVQIATHTQIGRHVYINRGALIGHHNIIQDHATISPGANLAGNVTVGPRVWVGLGANILEKITIGKQSIVGAGSLVVRDVPEKVKVIGAPAVIIEEGVEGL